MVLDSSESRLGGDAEVCGVGAAGWAEGSEIAAYAEELQVLLQRRIRLLRGRKVSGLEGLTELAEERGDGVLLIGG